MGLVKVASAAFDVMKNSIDGAVTRFDTMQKFPKVMKALGFSAEDSSKSINKLSDGIDGLPTTLQDVVAQTQQLTAITGDLNKSTDTVLALNNAFLASGASTEDASRGMQQFNQMVAKGQVDLQSWRTLQETMPLALQKTAEAMGFVGKTAQTDLYDALQSGTVTFDEFNDKLIELGTGTGMLANLAKENSLGIKTSFTNLKNSVVKGMANMLTSIDEVVQKVSGKTIASNIDSLKGVINNAFNSVNESIKSSIPFIEKYKGVVSGVFGTVSNSITNYIEGVMPIIEEFKNSFSSSGIGEDVIRLGQLFSDTFKNISGYISESKKVILENLVGVFSQVVPVAVSALKTILEQANEVADSVFANLIPAIESLSGIFNNLDFSALSDLATSVLPVVQTAFQNMFHIISGTLDKIIPQISNLVNSIVNAVLPVIDMINNALSQMRFDGIMDLATSIIPAVQAAFERMWEIASPALEGVIESFTGLWNAAQPLLSILAEALMPVFEVLGSFLGGVFKGVLIGVKFLFDALKIVIEILTPVVEFLVNVFKACEPVLSAVAEWVGVVIGLFANLGSVTEGLGGIIQSAWTNIQAAISMAGSIIGSVVEGIKGFFTSLGSAGGSLSSVLSGAWNGIKNVISSVGSAIGGVINNVKGFFTSLGSSGNTLKSTMSGAWNGMKNVISNAGSAIGGVVDKIKNLFTSLWDIDISGAGSAIMDGFLGGLQSAWGKVQDFVGGIAGWISENKGPIEYDRRLLIPQGKAIMDSLNKGLVDRFSKVKSTIADVTSGIVEGVQVSIPDIANVESVISSKYSVATEPARKNDNVSTVGILVEQNNLLKQILAKDTTIQINDEPIARAVNRVNAIDDSLKFF